MILPRYRALRFAHPDVDAPEISAGLRLSPAGAIEMVEDHASVRQAVLLLLSTLPGERVLRPEYGCEIYKLVFSPNDDTTAGLAIHYVRQAVERWEPRVRVLRVDAGRSEHDPARLDVTLEYLVITTQRADQIELALALSGEQGGSR